MGWLITLGILFLLAILPLGVSAGYDEGGAEVKVLAGPVRIRLFPRKKKKPKEKGQAASKQSGSTSDKTVSTSKQSASTSKQSASTSKVPQKDFANNPEKKSGGSLTDFLPLIKIALNFLGDFRRKLRVNCLVVKLTLAGDDPCDLAENYGKVWAAIGNLMPQLEKTLVIKKREIDVQCDFTASETLVIARLDVTITLGRLICLGAVYGIRALTAFIKLQNKRKGGAKNE